MAHGEQCELHVKWGAVAKRGAVDICMAVVPDHCFSWDGHSGHRSIAPNLHWKMLSVRGESQHVAAGTIRTSCMYF